MMPHGIPEINDGNGLWPEQTSPVEKLQNELFDKYGLEVFIKRDDLLLPYGGNKWRKLKYNFLEMVDKGHREFLSFGGAFSNHIYASATLAERYGLRAIILVRGSVDDLENPVLRHARACGVKLVSMDRKSYANRYSIEFTNELKVKYPSAYIIPEGAANQNGLKGCSEIVDETIHQIGKRPDYWILGAGTGNTAAGIASRLKVNEQVIAVAALRFAIMKDAFQSSLLAIPESLRRVISVTEEYNFGGMAKWDDQLVTFIRNFERSNKILLDPIYTGKAMYALFDLVAKGNFERGSSIVFVHTGGMPGRMSFNYRFGDLLADPDH